MTEGQADNSVDDLAEEFARRWRAGEEPSVDDYAARHPQWADEIREIFPAIVLVEQLKPRREDAPTLAEPGVAPRRVPERVGEYRILREIGRGGMGVVYEALQESLDRRVALKLLPASSFADERFRVRFRRESLAAARLHHTNIVPVFGVGEHDGLWFYVMQLIDGRSLDAVIRDAGRATAETVPLAAPVRAGSVSDGPHLPSLTLQALTSQSVAHIGVQVADALAYAHDQGVLHRDIKPSNLLLDEHGIVWVTDFGVAKLLEEADLTHSGDFVGTLKYMPPERFQGQSDARSDVYSLGLTLYELLARRPAYADTTPQQIIQFITHNDPQPLRKVAPSVPPDLETIILKAAARDPGHRYQNAGELADDLRRFLDDRPILARRVTRAEQLWRWCRRNPALATATATAIVLMVTTTVVSVIASVTTVAASRSVVAANHDMEKALVAEKAQREHAELTSALALDALNGVYNRFAPTRLVVTPTTTNDDAVELPVPPALPPEAIPLLEGLLRTYEPLARAGGEFPTLQAQAAEANYRIGNIRQRLGRLEEAATAYRAAVELYSRLLPDSPEARLKLSRTCGELGRTLRLSQQFEEAGRMYDRAIVTMTDAPKDLAGRPEYRYELARALFASDQRDPQASAPPPMGPGTKGGPQGKGPPGGEPKRGPRGKGPPPKDKWRDGPPPPPDGKVKGKGKGEPPRRFLPGAERPLHQAAELLEKLADEFPRVPEYRHLLACCYRDMPPDPLEGRPPRESVERGIELLQQLVKEYPKVPDYRFDLCATLARPLPPERGRPGPPEMHSESRRLRLEEAVTLSAPLVADYPDVPDYAAAHARYLDDLGIATFLAGRAGEAEQFMRQAVALEQKLVKYCPDVLAYGMWLAVMERSLGHVLIERGEWPEARTRLQSSVDRLEALRKNEAAMRVPGFEQAVHSRLGVAYRDLIRALTGAGETGLADAARQKAGEFDLERGPDPFRGPPDGRR